MERYFPISNWAIFNGSYRPDFTWKIERLEKLLNCRETCSRESEDTFIWNSYPQVGARVRLTINNPSGMVSISLRLFLRQDVLPKREIRPIPTVYYVLRDRNGNGVARQHLIRSYQTPFGSSFSSSMLFERPLFHKFCLFSPLYNAEDSVVMEVYVEQPFMVHQIHSYEGILNWTIEKWSRRKMAFANRFVEIQESPYFYTCAGGYRAQAWISTNEYRARKEEEEEEVVLQMVFLSGENDPRLLSIFPHRASVTLMNPGRSRSQTVEKIVDIGGREDKVLIELNELASFIENDSFVIQIVIKPAIILPVNLTFQK